MIDWLSPELQEDHRGGLPWEAAEGARRGREADAVGHRGPRGVWRPHPLLLPRRPGLCGRLLHHGQRLAAGREEVEEEGGGRVRGHPHGPRPEQDRPHHLRPRLWLRGGQRGGRGRYEALQDLGEGGPQRGPCVPTPCRELRQEGERWEDKEGVPTNSSKFIFSDEKHRLDRLWFSQFEYRRSPEAGRSPAPGPGQGHVQDIGGDRHGPLLWDGQVPGRQTEVRGKAEAESQCEDQEQVARPRIQRPQVLSDLGASRRLRGFCHRWLPGQPDVWQPPHEAQGAQHQPPGEAGLGARAEAELGLRAQHHLQLQSALTCDKWQGTVKQKIQQWVLKVSEDSRFFPKRCPQLSSCFINATIKIY